MKRYFIICFLILSISTNIHANLYFSGTPKENIALFFRTAALAKKHKIASFISPIEKERWRRLETVYRIWREQNTKRWKKEEADYYSLKRTESLFFQISGLSLARIDVSKAIERLGSDVLESIEIYQVSGNTKALLSNSETENWTKVKIIPIVDDSGQIYIRAPVGKTISYEIRHQLEHPLKLGFFEMEYIPMNFFWEYLERRVVEELNSKADEFTEYLTSFIEKNIETSFIEKQLIALPWVPQNNITLAERQYRLAKFFYDVLYARREDNSAFKKNILKPAESGKVYKVKEEVFYEITPSDAINFKLTGPKLLKITTRFVYPSRIADEVQPYTLFCYEDGLLRKVIYKNTVLDDLEDITLDNIGRPLGRKRVDYLVVPPGKHEYRLVSEHHLLANLYERQKKLHLFDSLTNSENSGKWIQKALENAETILKMEPTNTKMFYLKGCCLQLMNLHDAAFAVYEELSAREEELNTKGEFLILAGVYLHLAQLYAEVEKYPEAFNFLSSSLQYCEKARERESQIFNLMIKSIHRERAKLFRRVGKHLEAAEEYRLVLKQFPMDVETRFLMAEALAWARDLAALEEYDKVLQLNPRDVLASNARQRFWWDYTYWQTLSPSSKQQGEKHRVLDFSETKWNGNWAATKIIITDYRRLPGFCEITPDTPTDIKIKNGKRKTENGKTEGCEQSEAIRRRFKPIPIDFIRHSSPPERKDLKNFPFQKRTSATKRVKYSKGESTSLKIICYANAETPWLLEIYVDGESKVQFPIIWERNEFELPISPGIHRVLFHLPQASLVSKILVNARLCDADEGQKRWHERIYFSIPQEKKNTEKIQPVLEYHVDTSAATYVRGLVHINQDEEKEFQKTTTLVVCIDDAISAEVVLESNANLSISEMQPYEFILPIPGGYHKIKIWQKDGATEAILNLSYRAIQKEKRVEIFLASKGEIAPSSMSIPTQEFKRTDAAAMAYYQGCEILSSVLDNDLGNIREQLLDTIQLFTKAIYLAEESDSIKYQTYVERANALGRLGKFELALSDCLKVVDSPSSEQSLKNQARIQLADIYLDMGGKQNALKALDEYARLLKDGVDNIHIRLKLGQIYQMEKEFEAATAQYDSVLEAYPDHPEALLYRAVIEIQKHHLSSAAATLDNLLDIFAKPPDDFLWKDDRFIANFAKYLRGKVAFLLGDFATAQRYFESLRNNIKEYSTTATALRSQAEWELARMIEAASIFELSKNAQSPAALVDLYYQIGEFNAAWIESPQLSWTDEIPKVYKEYWQYLGDENIIDYTAKTPAVVKDSGWDIGDYFLISDKSYVILQTKGPTLLKLDVRPAHILSDIEVETGLDIEVRIEEESIERNVIASKAKQSVKSIEGNQPSEEVVYPELTNILPGRRKQIIYKVGGGIHKLKLRTSSGIAHFRPYILHPSAETYFIMEKDNLLHIEQSKKGNGETSYFYSTLWYGRALVESLRLPDNAENLYRRAKCLSALNLNKERALEMLHQVLKEKEMDEAEYELGKLYLSEGELNLALLHFEKASKTDIEPLRKNSRLDKIRTMFQSPLHSRGLEAMAKEYDSYCLTYPDDIEAKLEFASLCLSLGDKRSDISSKTYWYNKALNIYTLIMQTHPELEKAVKGLTLAKSKTQWQRIHTVQNSAGHEDLVSMKSETSNFSFKLKEALSSPIWQEGSYTFINAQDSPVFSLSISHPVKIAIQLFGQMPTILDEAKKQAGYSMVYLQNGIYQRLIEGKFDEVISCEIGSLGTGQHILQFSLKEPNDEEFFMIRLLSARDLQSDYTNYRIEEAAKVGRSDWYVVRPNIVRKYFVATHETPIQTLIQGPTQLRLVTRYLFNEGIANPSEEYSFKVYLKRSEDEILEYSYQFTAGVSKFDRLRKESEYTSKSRGKGIGEIREVIIPILESDLYEVVIAPDRTREKENTKIAVRMYVRVSGKAGAILPYSQLVVGERNGVLNDSDIIEKKSHPLPIHWEESPPPKSIPPLQKYGTVEIASGYGENFEAELEERNYVGYTELAVRHRYRFEPAQLYHRGILATRLSGARTPVYNAEEFIYYQSPFRMIFRSKLEGFLQYVNGNPEAAVEFRTEVARNFRLSSDLTYIPRIGYAYKKQSLDNLDNIDGRSVSEDIFSLYDKQHDRQFFWENTFWYKPFWDVIIYGKGRIKTNRDLNPISPDYYYGRLAIKKLWVSRLESHTYYEVRKWLADKNRRKSRWENRLYANLEYGWWRNDTRLMLRITNRYSIEKKETFLYVSFGTAFSASRMLRDYNPSEIDFEAEKSYFSQ